MAFSKDQVDFLNDCILFHLRNLAFYDQLPADLNQLYSPIFENMEKARKWYNNLPEDRRIAINRHQGTDSTIDPSYIEVYCDYCTEIDNYIFTWNEW